VKIAHVLRRLSFADWGGTEQTVWNLAKAQAAAGHEVRIWATDALCKTPSETRDGLEIVRLPCIYPWWPMGRATRDRLDRKGGNPFVPGLGKALEGWGPGVVHCHAMGRIAELCIRTGGKTGAKTVVHLHGGAANVPREEARDLRAPTRRLLPWGKAVETCLGWKRRVPGDADGIVCVGEDEYEAYRGRHPHVLWLPNGVDAAAFAGGADAAARTRRGEGFLVVCVARIDRQKGQMALVDALGRRPELRVRLVGPATEPDYLDALLARAKALGAEGRLEVAGALPPGSPELAAEYGSADAFVLPSRHEPFGIAVLEAWAAGVPVAASGVGGMGRLLARHPGAALRFAPDDPAGLDAALERLETDPAWRASAVAAGREAAERHSWGALAAELVDFYATLG